MTLYDSYIGIQESFRMVPDIPLDNQKPAEYVFEKLVRDSSKKIKEQENQEEVAVKQN